MRLCVATYTAVAPTLTTSTPLQLALAVVRLARIVCIALGLWVTGL